MPQGDSVSHFLHALSEVIRERRQEKGLSLTQLGTLSGLSQQSVSYVERLQRVPKIDTLVRVSITLNVKLSELIREAEKRSGARTSVPRKGQ